MAHGGHDRRRVGERQPANNKRWKALGVDKKSKTKLVSFKRQIRSTERLLRKDTRPEVKAALSKKLEEMKREQEKQDNLALERILFLRDRKIKFFERRKIERRIRRLEKQQRSSSVQAQEAEIAEQLSKLKEDLEYIRFFPKTEKYISLFKKGDTAEISDKRNRLRSQIKANIVAAVASGKDLEETASDDDLLDVSNEDDSILNASLSDEADADDEWTDKSAREHAYNASGKAASGMSSDERNQRQVSARALMPPPRAANNSNSVHVKSRNGSSYNKKSSSFRRGEISSSSNTSASVDRPPSRNRRMLDSNTGNSSNLSSNSDARKPRRKRRPKKKKQQV